MRTTLTLLFFLLYIKVFGQLKSEIQTEIEDLAKKIVPETKVTIFVSFPQLVTFKTKDFQSY
jgi:hypothetical protein